MVTSDHIHLLAFDNGGRNVIPDSIKLVAGRTGQEFNDRKNGQGVFGEDRYHATAVEKTAFQYVAVARPQDWRLLGVRLAGRLLFLHISKKKGK